MLTDLPLTVDVVFAFTVVIATVTMVEIITMVNSNEMNRFIIFPPYFYYISFEHIFRTTLKILTDIIFKKLFM